MRFNLIDRIVEVKSGRLIRATKRLTLGEEYLADHFPSFPVMPGVLMLQSLIEAAAWLVRITEDFRHSVIVLREAKNVKYGSFMEPGKSMDILAEVVELGDQVAEFKGKGQVGATATVTARYTLARYNLCDRSAQARSIDDRIVEHLRSQHLVLTGNLAEAGECPSARNTQQLRP